jgi:hypothetical protein
MQLFADTCNIPVILPFSSGAAVVLGSAMLARFAAEIYQLEDGKALETQQDVDRASDVHRERLWDIMVSATASQCSPLESARVLLPDHTLFLVLHTLAGGDDSARCEN